ncbi:enoyl-CoA hydratase/isomerase family protein [Novosphingobium sp. JCM 18896]|uniref:enoyl-CoA hydratase/isomerase family protein n=1 Tax=Novosphingobium sp. JCM 18896 TaxID=2989731 RepID=UPI0022217CB7|nr:enoyl-CoA hydratase/isomerase family protein [Novosphingobium sp. JCM 18896]MCW1428657.1 enoyl-CoA hydratase/isomerase family protein [Novosphingobium sp. JCM 18896]
MSEDSVLVERREAITLVTLNRPERRNGITVDMCQVFYRVIQEVAASDARVVVLRGAGTDFCVGADLTAEDSGADVGGDPPTSERVGRMHQAAAVLHTMPQVTIAAIDGGCAGAGLGWATACDFRFATPEARFNTAFLQVGVSSDMGPPWFLTRIVGGARAREMMLFPGKITGEEALKLDLVTRLFPRASLHDEVLALAEELTARDPLALRMAKANLISAEELAVTEFITLETARQLETVNRPDLVARMAEAFRKSKG